MPAEEPVRNQLFKQGIPNNLEENVVVVDDEIYVIKNEDYKIDLESLGERLAQPTFSQSAKAFPRTRPCGPDQKTKNTYKQPQPQPVSSKEMKKIIKRVTKPTKSTQIRQKAIKQQKKEWNKEDEENGEDSKNNSDNAKDGDETPRKSSSEGQSKEKRSVRFTEK